MFQLSGLAYAPWDIHRYKRLTAAPELSWVGRTAFLVIPCFKDVMSAKELINQDVVTHFTRLHNTSIILVGGESKDLSHVLYTYNSPIANDEVKNSCASEFCFRLQNCPRLYFPMDVIPSTAQVEIERKSKRRVVDAAMLYNRTLQAGDEGRRSHQAVVDFDKPRWQYVNSIYGK
jgi:hypothetical protein